MSCGSSSPLSSCVPLPSPAEKALTLLLANNFTAPALLRPMVTRFMLPREELALEKMRMKGGEAVHARLLQAMIEFAVTPILSPRIHASRQLHDHRTLGDAPMAFGLVEFESAWNAATEARPLCFERLLLPGVLKGQAFPSHPTQGTFLDRHLRAKLGLDPPGKVEWGRDGVRGWRPRVLYITRLGAELKLRRTFLPESHEALLRLMEELGLQVRTLNEAVEGSAEGVFRSWEDRMTFPSQPLDSNEDDPELILFIPFTTDVKIKSIAIIGGADGTSPAKMRAFTNREDVDFSVVNDLTAVQEWDLTENLQGELEYTTKFSKFQGVSSLTLHFPSNFGGDFSRIHFVGLKGEATQNNRRAVAAVVYEAQANPSDHE
ncbi:unnamed protein product [Closterium sp. Naga37s-1]|nr:unnamed protein product [Closterium sp. Naga37s-1]